VKKLHALRVVHNWDGDPRDDWSKSKTKNWGNWSCCGGACNSQPCTNRALEALTTCLLKSDLIGDANAGTGIIKKEEEVAPYHTASLDDGVRFNEAQLPAPVPAPAFAAALAEVPQLAAELVKAEAGAEAIEGSEVVLEGIGGFIWGIETEDADEFNTSGIWGKAVSIEENSKFGLIYRLDADRMAKFSTRGVKWAWGKDPGYSLHAPAGREVGRFIWGITEERPGRWGRVCVVSAGLGGKKLYRLQDTDRFAMGYMKGKAWVWGTESGPSETSDGQEEDSDTEQEFSDSEEEEEEEESQPSNV